MVSKTSVRIICVALACLAVALCAEVAADPAIVIKNDGACPLPGADADGNLIFGGLGTATTIVENQLKIMVSCKGENITNMTGSAATFKGFLCLFLKPGGGLQFTLDSHSTVTPNGIGTMTCTVTK